MQRMSVCAGLPNMGQWCPLLLIFLAVLCWAEVQASYSSVESSTAFACEDGKLVLECQRGEVVRILQANYGRFTVSVCNKQGQTEGLDLRCRSLKARDIISERCDGRQRCEMHVNNHVFGDPCPQTSKYAEVKFSCQLDLSPRPPHITSAVALSPHEISLTWTQVEPASPIITSVIVLKDEDRDMEPSTIYITEQQYVIDNLLPNTTYKIHMKSMNSHGASGPSNAVTVSTLPLATIRPTPWRPGHIDQEMRGPSLQTTTTVSTTTTTTTTPVPSTTTTTRKPGFIVSPTPKPNPGFNPSSAGSVIDDDDRVDNPTGGGNVDKFCEETEQMGVLWPRTRFGRPSEQFCPEPLKGSATWICRGYGWEKMGPDLSDCVSPWLDQLATVMQGEEPVEQVAFVLSEAVRSQDIRPGDLKMIATQLLPRLTWSLERDNLLLPKAARKRKLHKFKKVFLETSSQLLRKQHAQSWHGLSGKDMRKAATGLLLSVESTGFQTARLMEAGEANITVDENIFMEVNVIDGQHVQQDMSFPTSVKEDLPDTAWHFDSLTITSASLREIGVTRGPIHLVFSLYKNMEELLQPSLNDNGDISTVASLADSEEHYNAGTIRDSGKAEDGSSGDNEERPEMVVNSKIIAASINSSKSHGQLAEPVTFTLLHLQPINSVRPVCAFWELDNYDMMSYPSGHWSQEGCRLLESNRTHSTCQCNHLTSFAVLMDVTGIQLSEEHELALRVITYVGCVISIFCLCLSWITFAVFKNLQCDRNTIHKNLVLCLLLAEIIFLFGISKTELEVLCAIIAGLLHYLFLAAFAWMCLEGVQLYVMLIEVFEQEKSRVHWYYLFGYGVPAVIVAVSAGIYHRGYGTDRHCWLTTDNYFIWSFVGPVLVVMLINIGMLSIAIYTMCRHSSLSATMRERSKVNKFSPHRSITDSFSSMETFASPKLRFPELPAWLKGAIVLIVLLGLTWMLGVLYLSEESVIMAYAFTVLNSLQGLFIFVFHCLKNEKVQKEYRKVARRTSWLPNCIRVNYGGYTGVASSSPVGSSGSGNYLSKLFGQKKRKHSANSTSNSAKPFLSKDQQRRSDTDNSTSRDSSNVPSSLNGYVYNPSYTKANSQMITPFLAQDNGLVQAGDKLPASLAPCCERDELAVDLSEYVDCSVVDSEFVSEYCKQNLQVSQEERRYSTGSEDSEVLEPIVGRNTLDVDNLSTLSLASSSRRVPSYTSSQDPLDRSAEKGLDSTSDSKQLDLQLDLHQYIIPTSRKHNNNNMHPHLKNVQDQSNKGEHKSASLNKLSKPVPSLSSIPESESSSPQHSSTPNLQFKPGFTGETMESSVTSSPTPHHIPGPGDYEEVTILVNNPSNASLPTLPKEKNAVNVSADHQGKFTLKHRHSDRDIDFRPIYSNSSDC